jgi:two-component system, sensor histidine kinase
MPNGSSPTVTVRDLGTWLIEEEPSGRDLRRRRVRPRFPDVQVVPADQSAVEVALRSHAAMRRRCVAVSPGRAEQQALDLQPRWQEVFVSTLAHELRQPLSVVSTAIEVVRLAPASEAASRATMTIQRQISQMSRVIEDLMDEMRWACGKVTLRKQRIDVRQVLRDAALDVAAAVAARGQELVVATASDALWVDADPQRLHQVLSNLLANAMKYTGPRGRISLAADRLETTVTLSVSDTGCGIDRQALAHVFDLFSQVRPAEGAGLGIGLSVVREIVALHRGRIEARSEGPGHGSEFIVTLPLAPGPAPRLANPQPG